jgi:hypothetical protein
MQGVARWHAAVQLEQDGDGELGRSVRLSEGSLRRPYTSGPAFIARREVVWTGASADFDRTTIETGWLSWSADTINMSGTTRRGSIDRG